MRLLILQNFGAYHLEFSSSIRQLIGLGVLFCQLNVTEKEAWVQQSKLAKMLCMGHREFGANRWRFLSKANTIYFRLCKSCDFMKYVLIVNHQLNRMHPRCSWECTLPERCSPGKRCHTFWNRNIVLLPVVIGKMSCVPEHTLCELYGVKGCEGLA